jgi:hypothetical protein
MDKHIISYYVGIFVILSTHLYLLSIQNVMPAKDMHIHSYINLVAALMIAYYFLNKEKFIEF